MPGKGRKRTRKKASKKHSNNNDTGYGTDSDTDAALFADHDSVADWHGSTVKDSNDDYLELESAPPSKRRK